MKKRSSSVERRGAATSTPSKRRSASRERPADAVAASAPEPTPVKAAAVASRDATSTSSSHARLGTLSPPPSMVVAPLHVGRLFQSRSSVDYAVISPPAPPAAAAAAAVAVPPGGAATSLSGRFTYFFASSTTQQQQQPYRPQTMVVASPLPFRGVVAPASTNNTAPFVHPASLALLSAPLPRMQPINGRRALFVGCCVIIATAVLLSTLRLLAPSAASSANVNFAPSSDGHAWPCPAFGIVPRATDAVAPPLFTNVSPAGSPAAHLEPSSLLSGIAFVANLSLYPSSSSSSSSVQEAAQVGVCRMVCAPQLLDLQGLHTSDDTPDGDSAAAAAAAAAASAARRSMLMAPPGEKEGGLPLLLLLLLDPIVALKLLAIGLTAVFLAMSCCCCCTRRSSTAAVSPPPQQQQQQVATVPTDTAALCTTGAVCPHCQSVRHWSQGCIPPPVEEAVLL